MSLVHNGPHQKGIFDFYDGQLRVKNASGQIDFDGIDASQYNQLIGEEVKPWSYMKFPYLRELGPQLGWYRVGPLARIQNCDAMPSELANAKRIEFMQSANGQMRHLPLSFHWARMIEMLHAAELIGEWLHDPNLCNASELVRQGTKRHEGFGILEAPRGTLIHHYRVDDDDLVSHCNLIVSTTHNNQAMNESIRSVAQQYLDGQNITEGLLNHIEVAIRAFDPCLSCATHALGKMPLNVELLDAQEQLIDHQQRGH
jgi:NAD-reducing hydrogenase large subunit